MDVPSKLGKLHLSILFSHRLTANQFVRLFLLSSNSRNVPWTKITYVDELGGFGLLKISPYLSNLGVQGNSTPARLDGPFSGGDVDGGDVGGISGGEGSRARGSCVRSGDWGASSE